jgi:hypothetical protein
MAARYSSLLGRRIEAVYLDSGVNLTESGVLLSDSGSFVIIVVILTNRIVSERFF